MQMQIERSWRAQALGLVYVLDMDVLSPTPWLISRRESSMSPHPVRLIQDTEVYLKAKEYGLLHFQCIEL